MKDKANLEGSENDVKVPSAAEGESSATEEQEIDWLNLAKTIYRTSTSFLNENFKKQFAKNLSNFQSEHPEGSKYNSDTYKTRSRLFRPKTRIAVRKNEAALAAAMFSATDNVVVEAEDSDDAQKRIDAAYWNEVLNYRLDKTIPWFKTTIGAFQEASIYGIVVSKQHWEYEEYVTGEVPMENPADKTKHMYDNETGDVIMRPEVDVLKDRPVVRLLEIENFRFDPAAEWTDPVNSSPYLIECIPMYLQDVMDKMLSLDPETLEPEWFEYTEAEVIAAGTLELDGKKKEGKPDEDKMGEEANNFKVIWVCEIIVKSGGQDLIYFTLGNKKLLTNPEPIKNVYKHAHRPFVLGSTIIEAHKSIPDSAVKLTEGLQAEANDVVNQRRDNVKLALNSRKFVDRNANVDLRSLARSTPGIITLTDDPKAVVPEVTRDVTSSAYADQDRVDADFDDMAGVFNAGTVANNRALNETVGGMELMSQGADQDTEYVIRTFVETWVEPVLKQLIDLEQLYEDDDHIKEIATKGLIKSEEKRAAKMPPPQAGSAPSPEAAEAPKPPAPSKEPQNIDVRVSVGFGNLNPDQRIKKIMSGLKVMGEIAPWAMANMDVETVANQIFSALGHKNGASFFSSFERPDPQQDPKAQLEGKKLQIEEAKLQSTTKLEGAKIQLDAQVKEQTLIMQYELGMAKIASVEGITMEKLYTQLGVDKEKLNQGWAKIDVDREIKGAMNMTKLADVENKADELQFKKDTGRDGI